MRCESIREKFADYLAGDLDEAGRRDVQDHISACAACREDLEDLSVIWAKLGVLPLEQPGPGLRKRFYSMLERSLAEETAAEKGFEGTGPSERHGGLRTWMDFRRPAFAAAFSAFLLIIGLASGWLLSAGPGARARLTRLSHEVESMRQQVALTLLRQPSASDRLLGVGYGASVGNPDDRTLAALFDALDTDPNPNVRLAAVEALYLFRDRPGVRANIVRSLAVQAYPLVQVALIDFLVDIREARAAEALKGLIESGELTPEVKERAEKALKQIV